MIGVTATVIIVAAATQVAAAVIAVEAVPGLLIAAVAVVHPLVHLVVEVHAEDKVRMLKKTKKLE